MLEHAGTLAAFTAASLRHMDDVAAIKSLESWIAENGGFTHPSLSIRCGARGRGVVTTEQLSSAELCRLPWRLLISEELAEQSLSFGSELRASAEEFGSAPGLLLLSAFLLQERAQSSASSASGDQFYSPYYQVLPRCANLPASWPEGHWLHSGIKGSHLERQIRAKRHSLGLEFSLLQSYAPSYTWEEFLWARSVVASRAYALRGQRCLVPWADLLNHGASHEVQARYHILDEGLQSDFVMALTKDLAKDEEVLQSYGEKPNAMLLLDYGFVLPNSAISTSVSITIPPPQIPDTDPQVIQKKKQLWLSSGGRGRETILELSRLNFDKHLQLQRAAAICSRSGEPNPGELSDDPGIEMAARDGCKTAAEQALRRSKPSIKIGEIGERTVQDYQDWEIVAQQACSQILDEERAVLQDFLSWLSNLSA
eukprot:s4083_g2.t1